MTTLAQRIKETPMAPYTALLRGMTLEQKRIVLTFIAESMDETDAGLIHKKKDVEKLSPKQRWNLAKSSNSISWNTQEAWNKLTEEQKEQAMRLNLTSEDIDERTFSILTR